MVLYQLINIYNYTMHCFCRLIHGQLSSPVTVGCEKLFLTAVDEIFGIGRVRMTPALVPTHSRSLQARSVVIRRQAVLCWRMMSSAAVNSHTAVTYSCHIQVSHTGVTEWGLFQLVVFEFASIFTYSACN